MQSLVVRTKASTIEKQSNQCNSQYSLIIQANKLHFAVYMKDPTSLRFLYVYVHIRINHINTYVEKRGRFTPYNNYYVIVH